MEEHIAEEWNELLEKGELTRDLGVRVSNRNHAIQMKDSCEIWALAQLPEKNEYIDGDKGVSHDGVSL